MNNDNFLTTANGAPVPEDDNSISAGERGPLTFDNFRLFEKLAHFNRERIPERVVHARGYGAHGTYTLSKDLSDYSIADFLQGAGKKRMFFCVFPQWLVPITSSCRSTAPSALSTISAGVFN